MNIINMYTTIVVYVKKFSNLFSSTCTPVVFKGTHFSSYIVKSFDQNTGPKHNRTLKKHCAETCITTQQKLHQICFHRINFNHGDLLMWHDSISNNKYIHLHALSYTLHHSMTAH